MTASARDQERHPADAPTDRRRDSARLEAFARLLRDVALKSPPGRVCSIKISCHALQDQESGKPYLGGPGLSVTIDMPREVSFASYDSTAPLTDPEWEGAEPRYYYTPDEAWRAALDNLLEREKEKR